jgi:hypothetical protein
MWTTELIPCVIWADADGGEQWRWRGEPDIDAAKAAAPARALDVRGLGQRWGRWPHRPDVWVQIRVASEAR